MTESTPREPSTPVSPAEPPAEHEATATATPATGKQTDATASETGASVAEGIDTDGGDSGAAHTRGDDGAAGAARDGGGGQEEVAAAGGRRRLLVWAGVAVAVVLVAVAIILAITRSGTTEVGECVRETTVVSCDDPHDAKIVQIVGSVNDCVPPATHAIKEAEGRYLCLVEDAT